jgi:hypothetical protein
VSRLQRFPCNGQGIFNCSVSVAYQRIFILHFIYILYIKTKRSDSDYWVITLQIADPSSRQGGRKFQTVTSRQEVISGRKSHKGAGYQDILIVSRKIISTSSVVDSRGVKLRYITVKFHNLSSLIWSFVTSLYNSIIYHHSYEASLRSRFSVVFLGPRANAELVPNVSQTVLPVTSLHEARR